MQSVKIFFKDLFDNGILNKSGQNRRFIAYDLKHNLDLVIFQRYDLPFGLIVPDS